MEDAIKQGNKTSINSLTHLVGNIKAEEDLIIDGKMKGNVEIKNHSFFLGPGGRLKGNIYGQNVRIRGQMQGEIIATGKVEITRKAKFSGKITGKSISVEKGAHFDADVNLGQDTPENESLAKAPNEKPST
jgi:cytoskeletal protein CcmA (bactofilin family)